MSKPLILRPSAGLANRMRAVDSCTTLCRRINRDMEIIWFKDRSFGARFHDIFEPLDIPGTTLREARFWEIPLYDVPIGRRNLRIPLLFERLRFGHSRMVSLWETQHYRRSGIIPEIFRKTGKTVYFACGHQVVPTELRYSMFRPRPDIMSDIEAMSSSLPPDVAGVHVRRGDHRQAIRESPLELFENEIRRLLDSGEASAVFLASDSNEVKRRLVSSFGKRIITRDISLERNSAEGIREAVIDLWTLSRCTRIIGSSGSTFAETAAWMGRRPYSFLKKPV